MKDKILNQKRRDRKSGTCSHLTSRSPRDCKKQEAAVDTGDGCVVENYFKPPEFSCMIALLSSSELAAKRPSLPQDRREISLSCGSFASADKTVEYQIVPCPTLVSTTRARRFRIFWRFRALLLVALRVCQNGSDGIRKGVIPSEGAANARHCCSKRQSVS